MVRATRYQQTRQTLLAGLSSTIFAPLTAALLDHGGWRHTYLMLAAILGVVTIPAHLLGLRGPWPDPVPLSEPSDHHEPGAGRAPRQIMHSRPFVLLVVANGLGTFTAFAVVVNQVPLLLERGLSTTTSAWALGLGGLGQVLGRLGYGRLTAAAGVRSRGVIILGWSAAATALLAIIPGPAAVLIAAATMLGTGAGRGQSRSTGMGNSRARSASDT